MTEIKAFRDKSNGYIAPANPQEPVVIRKAGKVWGVFHSDIATAMFRSREECESYCDGHGLNYGKEVN